VSRPPRSRGSSPPSGTWDLVACCDLLAVAATAGCSLRQAVVAVGHSGTGPVARALAGAGQDVQRGTPLVQAVESLTDRAGADARPLVSALVVAAGSGTPVAPALQRLADAERRRARRAVEARVRRLPVLLLVPLVTCILPAFVVLTLVPVGIAASRNGLAGSAFDLPSPIDTVVPGVRHVR
jgi:tight adherence protein C